MLEVSRDQILARLRLDNPWWRPPHSIAKDWAALNPRAYLDLVYPLVTEIAVGCK